MKLMGYSLPLQNEPQRTEPIDYEAILSKGRVIFTNDPHRELLLFPPDDVLVSCQILQSGSKMYFSFS